MCSKACATFGASNGYFLNDYYKVNPIGQWDKILDTVMGFAVCFSFFIFSVMAVHNPRLSIYNI